MMTLTRYGFREWGTALLITALILAGCVWLARPGYYDWAALIAALAILAFLLLAAFFRNPRRTIPCDDKLLCSPADGEVRDIGVVEDFNFPPFEGKAMRIGIFLSVLNVHVNRAPAELEIESKYYREGECLDARHPECDQRNEAMTIAGIGTAGGEKFPMALRQISGKLARKIVCPVEPGKKLKRGETYGMIKFGSRTELYLPVGKFDVNVNIGDKVRGGETVVATLKQDGKKKR